MNSRIFRSIFALVLSVAGFAAATSPAIHERFFAITLGGGQLQTGDGNWGSALPGSGSFQSLEGEPGRPGILRMRTSNAIGSTVRLFKAPGGWESGLYPNPIRFDGVTSFVWRARLVSNTDVSFVMALNNQIVFAPVAGVSNVGFYFDTNVNGSLRCMTTLNGSQTVTSVAMPTANAFHDFEVISTPGQVDFLIDGVVVATHTTDIPAGQALTPYAELFARANAHKQLDFDEFQLD
jgi:hypothetical protein